MSCLSKFKDLKTNVNTVSNLKLTSKYQHYSKGLFCIIDQCFTYSFCRTVIISSVFAFSIILYFLLKCVLLIYCCVFKNFYFNFL